MHVDGVKIKLSNIELATLLIIFNELRVQVVGNYDATTGEILDGNPLFAKYRGLTFKIMYSSERSQYNVIISGSLHKYFTNGESNSTDFKFYELKQCLIDIESTFKQPLSEFELQNIEFTTDIELKNTSARHIINSIISNGHKQMVEINIKRPGLGKTSKTNGGEYELKIYDKGRQAGTGAKNILRIEIKVKKMRFLKDYGIKTLNSLLSRDKIGILGQILAKYWSKLIFYDGSIDESMLTPNQKIKLAHYQNPLFWDGLTRKQRYRERLAFNALLEKYSLTNPQKEIEILILDNCKKSVNWKRKQQIFWVQNHQHKNNLDELKTGTKSQFKCNVISSLENNNKTNKFQQVNCETEKRFCLVCKTDISHLKKSGKYCSKKCRNKANNSKRQYNRILLYDSEAANLKKVLPLLRENRTRLTIIKTNNSISKTIRTNSDKLKSLYYNDLRKITQVDFSIEGKRYSFTATRAKQLIKHIAEINNSKI